MKIIKFFNLEFFFALIILFVSYTQLRFFSKIGIGELFILIFFLISVFLSIKNRVKILKREFIYLFLVIGYLIYFGLYFSLANYSNTYGIVLFDIFAYILSFLLLTSLLFLNEFDIKKSVNFFIYLLAIFSFLFLIFLPDSIIYYLNSRFRGLSNNPNQLAFTLLFAQFTYLYFYNLCPKTYFILTIIFILGYLTGSDAYFFSSIISYLLLIFNNLLSISKINIVLKIFVTISLSLIIILIFLTFYDFNTLSDYWTVYDEDNTRYSLYLNGIKSWLSSNETLIFGNGVGRFSGVSFSFNFREAHNSYIDVLNNFGIVGFLLIFVPIFYRFIESYFSKDNILFTLILSLLIYIFFHMVVRQPYFWILWYLVIFNKREKL